MSHKPPALADIPDICMRCGKNCRRFAYRNGANGCRVFEARPADDDGKCWGFTDDLNWEVKARVAVKEYAKCHV